MKTKQSWLHRPSICILGLAIVLSAFVSCNKSNTTTKKELPKTDSSKVELAKANADSKSESKSKDSAASDASPTTKSKKELADGTKESPLAESVKTDPSISDPNKGAVEKNKAGADLEPGGVANAPKMDPSIPPQPDLEKTTTQRILIMSRRGPILVDLWLSVNDELVSKSYQKFLENVVKMADVDKDGSGKWSEVFESELFQNGLLGNTPFNGSADQDQMLRRYDLNRNGLVDLSEVGRFLTNNNQSASSLQFVSTSSDDDSATPPLLDALDENEDGVLDKIECQRARAILSQFDVDGDEIIFANDISQQASNMQTTMRVGSLSLSSQLAHRVQSGASLNELLYNLEAKYAGVEGLDKSTFTASPHLFDNLNTDKDELLSERELNSILKIPPDVIIKTDFDLDSSVVDAKIHWLAPFLSEVNPKTNSMSGAFSVHLDQVDLLFNVSNFSQPANEIAKQFMDRLDSDKNEYLDEKEVESLGAVGPFDFDSLDTNSDGKVFLNEIEDFYYLRRSVNSVRVSTNVSRQQDMFFAWLDSSKDQRLTTREIQNSALRLIELDANEDGYVELGEFPERISFAISRGDPQAVGTANQPPAMSSVSQVPASLPQWFQRMDSNGDSEISGNEFLGTAAQFSELDSDSDGFISGDEIETPNQSNESAPLPPNPEPNRSGSKRAQ